MRSIITFIFLLTFISSSLGQNCTILSKANNITPDKLCAPVTVDWEVTYTGVNDEGTPVSIRYVWNDGTSETVSAIRIGNGVFQATSTHVYTSRGRICNYHPQATLMVNGVLCTSSTQEQIVTVWDDDDHNGGIMRINPRVWPICFGRGDNVRFQDLTQFNCVPPQERDNPNVSTRWIQWIYGTDITMTGTPVKVGGRNRSFPYISDVITLPGPVTGSGVWTEVINVSNDKQIGEYFEVTLKNWNYCNPYDDPNIPGEPRDKLNGDHPPVITTARILIVDYPDATITPVLPLCENASPVVLTAADDGGSWSGTGVQGNRFDPSLAGAGSHIIQYNIMNANGCTDSDTVTIAVKPVPDATIISPGPLCNTDPPITLTAVDSGGVWFGTGMIGNVFHPLVAGYGNHTITYELTLNGCTDRDTEIINVATPDATITPVDTLCVDSPPVTLTAHDMGGQWIGDGIIDGVFYPSLAGSGMHAIFYNIINPGCSDSDTIFISVVPIPVVLIEPVDILYINTPPITLHAIPSGGIWSGIGVRDSIFDPTLAGVGIHTITYQTLRDRFGCGNSDTIRIEVQYPPTPNAYWIPDTSGCTPLTVQFRNLSTDATSYIWDFGDKTYSNQENPVHTYYIPGNYVVRMTATNIVGSSYHQKIFKVFQSPTAQFTAYPTNVINNEQIVVFDNTSYNGNSYLWNFGDTTTSTDENPYHKYERPGTYRVTLYVTSDNGCVDSVMLQTPIIVDWKTGRLRYPTVFKWNGSGPTGGYWVDGQHPEMDFVFRPHYENIIEYKLQIFNRWGELIYESHDLNKGWDGYHRDGTLSPQGVYVWKATVRYTDGTYENKVGDITFLH